MTQHRANPRFLWLAFALLIVTALFWGLNAASEARAARPLSEGAWLPAAPGLEAAIPQARSLSSSNEEVKLTFSFSGIQADPAKLDGQLYTRLSGLELGSDALPGQPELPFTSRSVQIPFGAEVRLEISGAVYRDVSLSELGLPQQVLPAQIPQTKSGPLPPPTAPDAAAYAASGFLPAQPAAAGLDYIQRGRRGLEILLHPVQYNPAAGTLRIYSQVDVTLHLIGGDAALTRQMAERYASPEFEALQAATLLNYGQPGAEAVQPAKALPGYLIITANAYASGLAPFVTLKQNQGYAVTLATLSQTGATNTAIKTYIQNFYNTHPSLAYLLLVGDLADDPDTMPTWPDQSSMGTHLTDLYYATLAGADSIPDIGYGRFPVRDTTQLANMVNKAIAYEAANGSEVWVKKAAFLGTSDTGYYTLAEGTHNYVISSYTAPAGYMGIFPANPQAGGDKLYAITYGATTPNVMASLNDGRSMIIYSGHGSETYWAGPSITQADVRSLTSSGVLPYVAGHACVTGTWNTIESFAETWVIQENKGALVYLGSSDNTYWDEDDVLERKMFDLLFGGSKPSISAMLAFGHTGVQTLSGSDWALYYREEYHIFGDPSVKLMLGPRNPDFTLAADPSVLGICSAGQAASTLNVGNILGFSDPVSLSISGLPAGVTGGFSVNPVTPPSTSLLTLNSDGSPAEGTYSLSVQGVAGTSVHSTSVDLTLINSAPGLPPLVSPANGSSDQPLRPLFTWSAVPLAERYTLEIASDSGFSNILVSAETTEPTYTPTADLPSSTRLYWRVRARNACGENTATAFNFTTLILPGDCPKGTTPSILLSEGFEGDITGWTTSTTNAFTWAITQSTVHSGEKAFMAPDPSVTSDLRLISPPVPLPASGLEDISLQYHNWRDMESSTTTFCYDGGILEISSNAGATWSQVTGAALLTDPYTGLVSSTYTNPLAGLKAWCGASSGWIHSVVDLQAYAGQTVQFRFRLGSDNSVGKPGWAVDDVRLQGCTPEAQLKIYLPAVLLAP